GRGGVGGGGLPGLGLAVGSGDRGCLPPYVALVGEVLANPPIDLTDGQVREQGAQLVPVLGLEFALLLARKEALERRLDDVLGVFLGADRGGQPGSGEADEPAGVAVDDQPGGGLVAGLELVHQLLEQFFVWHGEGPPNGERAS